MQRKKRAGKEEKQVVETHETLVCISGLSHSKRKYGTRRVG
jgi:hypothetical protein